MFIYIRDLIQDVRYSSRLLAKTPGFVLVAVISLALGIGANLAIFSLLNAILLRTLPVPNPHELRLVNWVATEGPSGIFSEAVGGDRGRTKGRRFSGTFSYAAYRDMRAGAKGLAEVYAFRQLNGITIRIDQEHGLSHGLMVSGNFFKAYGRNAWIGRTLGPEDDVPGAEPAAVITYRLWERRFGRDPKVLGRTIGIERNDFTIVGVLPPDYVGPITGDAADVCVSMAAQPKLVPFQRNAFEDYGIWWVRVAARMAPNVSDAQLHAALAGVFSQVKKLSTKAGMAQADIDLKDGSRGIIVARQNIAPALYALQGLVATVLLIACINLAGLLLARGSARRHEYAVCAALGAGRGRLIREALIESFILALGGLALGLIVARWIRDGLMHFIPQTGLDFHLDARFDIRVLLFMIGLTSITALLCGLLPAWRSARVEPAVDLQAGRTLAGSRSRLGRLLVSAQVALSLMLVAGTGLFARSLGNLRAVDLGFNPKNLLLFRLDAPRTEYQDQRVADYFNRIRESLIAVPGVEAAAYSQAIQSGGFKWESEYRIEGNPNPVIANWFLVSDDYLAALGIPLLRGRAFNSGDVRDGQQVAVVNGSFARRYFPGKEPIDQIFKERGNQTGFRIVGVCGDTQAVNVKGEKTPTIYFSHRQQAKDGRWGGTMYVTLRSSLSAIELLPAARKAVAAVDPSIPPTEISTQIERINQTLLFERLFGSLCASVAGLAVLLSCIGLYGLLSYNVARRRAEIGVRMALGARSTDVIGEVLREALSMTAWGMAVGLPIALIIGHLARTFFFGVKAYDPVMIGGTVLTMMIVTGLAAWLPARCASRVDPIRALRCE